jgi:uroporphyrinogen decarboxylase
MLKGPPKQTNPEKINHFERVKAALNHKLSDRAPLTLGSPSSSMHHLAQTNLLKYLALPQKQPAIITDIILQIAETDPRLLDLFDIDLVWLLPRTAEVQWNDEHSIYTDAFGRQFKIGGGFFNQTASPLADSSKKTLKNYKFPTLKKARFEHLGTQAVAYRAQGYGLGIDGPWGLYEISSSLNGTENYLINLLLNPSLARQIAEAVLENYLIPFYELLLEETAESIQIVGISDDLGAQQGLLFAPKIYREIFKPLHKQLIDHIHTKTNAKVYMHSDGAITPIIPDLIEIGVEGLNPVQYTAKDMRLEKLVKEFGKDIGFFGGVIENTVLSTGKPDEIRQLVCHNVNTLKREKGFIFAPIHNISQEVPPENILALYQTGAECGKY